MPSKPLLLLVGPTAVGKTELAIRLAERLNGEIDLVTQHGDVTVFIEVKTRTSDSFGPPEVAVSTRKQQHMIAAAEQYAAEHNIDHWRIDVIAVEGRPGTKPVITHFESII